MIDDLEFLDLPTRVQSTYNWGPGVLYTKVILVQVTKGQNVKEITC